MGSLKSVSRFAVIALIITVFSISGCEKGSDEILGSKIEFTYEMLYGYWGAIEIQGSLDPNGNPLAVDSTISSIYFDNNGSYATFLNAPPWYMLYGDGTYEYLNGRIYFKGIFADMFSETGLFFSVSYTPGSNTISFSDNDGDRWIYKKL